MAGETTVSSDNITAAAKIFEEHGDFIYRIIQYKTSDKSLIDDIFQDFFLALAARSVSLEGPKLRAFLYRAIINDIRDAARRVQRYSNLLEKYAANCVATVNSPGLKDASSIEEKVQVIIKNAWQSLSPKETTAISLRYFNGCSLAEAAQKMQVKPPTISRYVCVGLGKIRQCLDSKTGGSL
jgi:RNA polymerase sigma factor (sigma-70 family)